MDHIEIEGIRYTLAEIEKDCWVRMLNGYLKAKNPFHNPTVANVNVQGVNIRTVVLRNVSTKEKTLAFHTDIRSGKWAELLQNNNISWLFYDAAGRFQIRLSGKASLHQNDELAKEAWLKSNENSRKIYMGEIAPSQISNIPTSGILTAFENINPTLEESETARKNFGVVLTNVCWMEWLWLNKKGHRRASFNYKNSKIVNANWLVP